MNNTPTKHQAGNHIRANDVQQGAYAYCLYAKSTLVFHSDHTSKLGNT